MEGGPSHSVDRVRHLRLQAVYLQRPEPSSVYCLSHFGSLLKQHLLLSLSILPNLVTMSSVSLHHVTVPVYIRQLLCLKGVLDKVG